MISVQDFVKEATHALQETFGERLWFVGLQGSYARGEATETSDVDLVVILDELYATDIQNYRALLDRFPHRELICGFFGGKLELLSWEPSDLFQFYYDTKPILGSLDELLPLLDCAAVERAIKLGACNIYHGCVHNMLHERSEDVLKALYKSASFVVQVSAFQRLGKYVRFQKELLEVASDEEKYVVSTFLSLKNGETVDFEPMSKLLFNWAKNRLKKY